MKCQVILPCPSDNEEVWLLFKPFIQRFCDTWRQFPPGVRCTLFAVVQGADASEELIDMFTGLPVVFDRYDKGADLGAQQYIARLSDDAFQVNMTTRCYFHREGWLAELLRQRLTYGPTLYGMSCSMEGGKFHICTRGHSYDVEDFKLYPFDITSRDQGVFFECGDGSLTDFFLQIRRVAYVVQWGHHHVMPGMVMDGFEGLELYNGFRNGDQSDMLIFDKHTDNFRDADDTEKRRLHDMAYPKTPIQSQTLSLK